METTVTEISAGVYRLSTFVPDVAPPAGFTFNQFLIDAEEPMLFHTGLRQMFPTVSHAVARVLPVERLRWVSFGHFEADECGAMNDWLRVAPAAQVAHGGIGVNVSITDQADRAPLALGTGEVLDLGGKRVRWIDTPHVPHGWDAGVLFEEVTGTLLCGDLFTQVGNGRPLVDHDVVGPAAEAEDLFQFTCLTPTTAGTIRGLADLAPTTLALMHGPSFSGDGAAALKELADEYDRRFARALSGRVPVTS